jgi:serine/threonine protein kinase
MRHIGTLSEGDVLGNRYKVLSVIGKGGMGTVYLAEDLSLGRKYRAIKESILNREFYQQFIDEANMLIELDHPYLPKIYDYYPPTQDGQSFLVMDYIKGETLEEIFKTQNKSLPVEKVIRYSTQLCNLFDYLHHHKPAPIIYRDLKPSNIMIDEQDNVRLIDFGIARTFKEGQDSDTIALGTKQFASPEQFNGTQTDQRTDIFSLGAMMYYLLSNGQYFYTVQKPLHLLNENIPLPLSQVVEKLTQLDKQNRYQSMKEVKDSLVRMNEKETGSNHFNLFISRLIQNKLMVGAVTLLLVVVGFILFQTLTPNEEHQTNGTKMVADDLITYQEPVFAFRETPFTPVISENLLADGDQLKWKMTNDKELSKDEVTTQLSEFNGKLKYEFEKPGDYEVALYLSTSDGEELLSKQTIHVLPPPKVWFTPIVESGEKLVANQNIELRALSDEAFKPVEWYWGYLQLFDGKGNKLNDTLKIHNGDFYSTLFLSEPGVYEVQVQAKDENGIMSDKYHGPIYVYSLPKLELGVISVDGSGVVTVPYQAETINGNMEGDFAKATLKEIDWVVYDSQLERVMDGTQAIDQSSGVVTIELSEKGNYTIEYVLIDSLGAKSVLQEKKVSY